MIAVVDALLIARTDYFIATQSTRHNPTESDVQTPSGDVRLRRKVFRSDTNVSDSSRLAINRSSRKTFQVIDVSGTRCQAMNDDN